MFGKFLRALTPSTPTFDVFAEELIQNAMTGAPAYALKKLYLFQKRLLPSQQQDPFTFGRAFLLEAILHSLNSGKLGVVEPLQKAKSAFQIAEEDVSLEMDAIEELELFINDEFQGHLVSSDTSVGKWLLSFKGSKK